MNILTKKGLLSITALLAFLLLQGCAANVKLSTKDRLDLKKQTSIKVLHLKAGWPSLHTPLGVLASDLTFGMSDDWSEGQKLVKKFKIKDPSQTLKLKFLNKLKRKKVANFVSIRTPLTYDGSATENLKKKYKRGVVLKILPGTWQIWYYPFSWGSYQMWYRAAAELVRLDDSKVLWSSACKAYQDDDSSTAPSLDELTANNSKILQNWVNKSTSQCANQLVNDFMGLTVNN